MTTSVDPTIDSKSVLAPGSGSVRWTGTLTPPATGDYRFSLTVSGNAKLFIGGKRVIARRRGVDHHQPRSRPTSRSTAWCT